MYGCKNNRLAVFKHNTEHIQKVRCIQAGKRNNMQHETLCNQTEADGPYNSGTATNQVLNFSPITEAWCS